MTRKQKRTQARDRKQRAIVHSTLNYVRKYAKKYGFAGDEATHRRVMVRWLWN